MSVTALPLYAQSRSSVRDYIALLKPRVMSLVVFSGWVGMMLAPGELHPFRAIIAIAMIALGSGAAGAINMWYDRDIDQHMARTKLRPIPRGIIEPEDALFFAGLLAVLSVTILAFAVNYMAAFLLAVAILYYVFVYTIWLKRRTPQNIVIGGAAGALPPVIGWVAVTGQLAVYPWLLFLIIFFWTCPHFWALALLKVDDYERAKVPMLPNVRGVQVTKHHIFVYTILTVFAALLPLGLGYAGSIYAILSTPLNLYFLLLAWRAYWYSVSNPKPASTLFAYSIFYLFALFSLLWLDHLL